MCATLDIVSATTKHITLRIGVDALEAAELIAKEEGRSRNGMLCRLIGDSLNRRTTIPCRRCGQPRPVNAYCPCDPRNAHPGFIAGPTLSQPVREYQPETFQEAP